MLKRKGKKIILIITVLLVGVFLAGPLMSQVETPSYEIVTRVDNIEIRRYAPMIIAEVTVQGERREAISAGFRLLADYIFGNNRLTQEIAMTAPVEQQSTTIDMTAPVQQQSTTIDMTTPVQQQPTDEAWLVSFVMPASYTLESLPKPNNQAVTLHAIPSQLFAVIRFSGRNTDSNIQQHKGQLLDYIKSQGLVIQGETKYAFYDPPWTLPVMRRNEVMVQLDEANSGE